MALFRGFDGELRIIEYGNSGTTYHMEILFCEMDFSGPLARTEPEEILRIHRGRLDSDANYIEGPDDHRYLPLDISFSCRLADTVDSNVLGQWLSGVTNISGTTQLYSWKGKTSIDGIQLPAFSRTDKKYAYRVEVVWEHYIDEDIQNRLGLAYNEVWFPPQEQSISESENGLMLDCEGKVYGDVTFVTSFLLDTANIV